MIDNQLTQRIKDAVDIVELIGEYVHLRKSGSNYIGTCPFHDDSKPSMFVSNSKQIYKCFACGAGGDVFAFIQNHEHVSFPEAVRIAANFAHITIEEKEISPEDMERIKERESLELHIDCAAQFYESNLPQAEKYLNERGISLDDPVLRLFRIGYAPEKGGLQQSVQGYNSDNFIKVNVLSKGERGLYDTFRDRIMFPFFSISGKIIGFSGRIVANNQKTAKYLNTNESPLFTKGENLFGLFQAKKHIEQAGNVYLVEGQFDVISLHRVGIKNVVAGSGTALTTQQIKLLSRFTDKVTLLYDSDAAGIKASIKNVKSILSAGMTVRCASLPAGQDPDDLAKDKKEQTGQWIASKTVDFVAYFSGLLNTDPDDPDKSSEAYNTIAEMIACVKDDVKRSDCVRILAKYFNQEDCVVSVNRKIKSLRSKIPVSKDTMKDGIYGIEELKGLVNENTEVVITDDFNKWINNIDDTPTIYVRNKIESIQIQELRSVATVFTVLITQEELKKDVSDFINALAMLYKHGITDIVVYQEKQREKNEDEYEDLNDDDADIRREPFILFLVKYLSDKAEQNEFQRAKYIEQCAEIISYASESERVVNQKRFMDTMQLSKANYNDILKPYLDKRKARIAINAQRTDNSLELYDPDRLPKYVEDSTDYSQMYKDYGYYPLINTNKEPVAYMFRNDKGGHTIVGDFYLEPLIHIFNEDPEQNKRLFKVYRRFYSTPIYLELKSSCLRKLTNFEEVIINYEALNFDNGTNDQWTKIKSSMSRKYTTVREIKIYGQQNEDFYSFSNAIFHSVNGVFQVDLTNDLGVAKHGDLNYYAPAYSTIYRNMSKDDDRYETIRQFKFSGKRSQIDPDDTMIVQQGDENEHYRRKRFSAWADLMNKVYCINDNGKWAILYAVMCAFRSDIHSIDRLFTALFFMGPTMSGKTQIALSIRSLFMDPSVPAFNLNTGTDAAFATLMGLFRDVPIVLEEYNNMTTSDVKFQALKSVTYDGDGKQKRKSTSGRDLETDKVYTPVIISGQETPQRDDNALMNRIIVCEVPKRGMYDDTAKAIFNELKQMEKEGLSDVLFEVLQLRPLIQKHFRYMLRSISKQLSDSILIGNNQSGDMVRLINTVSLFLVTCKIIQDYAPHLILPFKYEEFFEIASKKVITQVELITHTDKLATFFKAMDVMINTGTLKPGRDYDIAEPLKLTLKLPGNEKKTHPLQPGAKVLFLRMSNIYTMFSRSSFNTENASQSTIEQNLRSNPAYIGVIDNRKFNWLEVKEVPVGDVIKVKEGVEETTRDMTMKRIMDKKQIVTSCIAIDYSIFKQFYEIDLERDIAQSDDEGCDDLPF